MYKKISPEKQQTIDEIRLIKYIDKMKFENLIIC